ncbi:MAG TPA: hypothetical protein PL037_07280 [Elusimicrobiales bacterium]|nr:hypothetical protein [Elusimicrobiales bacterium]
MKSFTGIIFLLLFAASLAVPAFIFYAKWSNKKAADAAMLTPGRRAAPSEMFGGGQERSSLPAAVPESPRAAPGEMISAKTAQARQPAAEALKDQSAAMPARTAPAAAVSTTALRDAAPSPAEAAPAQPGKPGAYFNPRTGRDPTLSPMEYAKLKEEEDMRLAAERRRMHDMRRREREDGGENIIELQGIVGQTVIIGGRPYSRGSTVRGIKIVKIGSDYIIGEYKGKQFKKLMR